MRSSSRLALLIGLALVFSVRANAVPTVVSSSDNAFCDVLSIPANVDELGNVPPFPVGEQISSAALGSTGAGSPCPSGVDAPLVPNQKVSITNLNSTDYVDLWYVADPETNASNNDGAAGTGPVLFPAFHIDNVGLNKPLLSESIIADNVFQVGETWVFVIQDFVSNIGGSPAAFTTIDVGVPGSLGSTGSIIGVAAPEPSTGLLVIAGLLALRGRRRVRA